ncbi:hypothetical protein EDB85DRAFT_2277536, partial [Lactarius pseudohatsudake]
MSRRAPLFDTAAQPPPPYILAMLSNFPLGSSTLIPLATPHSPLKSKCDHPTPRLPVAAPDLAALARGLIPSTLMCPRSSWTHIRQLAQRGGLRDSSRRSLCCALRANAPAAPKVVLAVLCIPYLSKVVLFSDLSTVLSHFCASLSSLRVVVTTSPYPYYPTCLTGDSETEQHKVNAQRKFVNLINEATFKWANWDPPRVIQIGDFGTIDKKSGELKVEGNIFTHPEIWHIAQDYPAFVAPETNLYQIHSQQVRRLDIQADVG